MIRGHGRQAQGRLNQGFGKGDRRAAFEGVPVATLLARKTGEDHRRRSHPGGPDRRGQVERARPNRIETALEQRVCGAGVGIPPPQVAVSPSRPVTACPDQEAIAVRGPVQKIGRDIPTGPEHPALARLHRDEPKPAAPSRRQLHQRLFRRQPLPPFEHGDVAARRRRRDIKNRAARQGPRLAGRRLDHDEFDRRAGRIRGRDPALGLQGGDG